MGRTRQTEISILKNFLFARKSQLRKIAFYKKHRDLARKTPPLKRKIYAGFIRYTRTVTQHIQSEHAKKCARQTRMERYMQSKTFLLTKYQKWKNN